MPPLRVETISSRRATARVAPAADTKALPPFRRGRTLAGPSRGVLPFWGPPSSASHALGTFPLEGGRLGRLVAAPTADIEAVPSFVGAGPRPARNHGPAVTCSAKPGAVVEPQQPQFLQTQGPVAREGFRAPLRFCAPVILQNPAGTRPPLWGPGVRRI